MGRLIEVRYRVGAASLSLAVAACSGTPATQGTGPTGSGSNGMSGAQSPAGQGGSALLMGVGAAGASMDGGSANGGAAGVDAGSSSSPDAGTLASRGCGLDTSCSPGNDLPVPSSADGFQIVTPPGAYTVPPGMEIFPNYCQTSPFASEFDVGTVQSWMTPGSSRDLMVYRAPPPAAGTGSSACSGTGVMMYMSSIAGQIVELKMPDGVGYPLQAGTQIIISTHFINLGTSDEQPQVKVNFLRAPNYQSAAAILAAFNTAIDVPAATAAGPGGQTVQGTCTVSAGSHFFAIGTHTNGHATAADVNFVSGGMATNVVHTTDWENPDVGLWPASPFLTLQGGDSLAYSCTYSNRGTSPITLGDTLQNEMCMVLGYYFPAGTGSCD